MSHKSKIRDLVIEPSPILHQISQPIINISQLNLELINDMVATMYHNDGVGLAAIQIGVPLRIFVMDTNNELIVFINPEIINKSSELINSFEGCLSLPTIRADIKRHSNITVRFMDQTGTIHTRTFDGLSSICIQHEIDHLNGIVFLDYLSKFKRDIFLKKLQKFKKS
jgi:peptide deformylase